MKKRKPQGRGPAVLTGAWMKIAVVQDDESCVDTYYAFGAFLEWLRTQDDNRHVLVGHFTSAMIARGAICVKRDDGWYYEGIQLVPDATTEANESTPEAAEVSQAKVAQDHP